MDPEDEAAIEKFMLKPDAPTRTLYDIISEKIEQKKSEIEFQLIRPNDDDFVVITLPRFFLNFLNMVSLDILCKLTFP